jgi:hypothetical protein
MVPAASPPNWLHASSGVFSQAEPPRITQELCLPAFKRCPQQPFCVAAIAFCKEMNDAGSMK